MDKVVAVIEFDGKILTGKVKEEKLADFGGIAYVFPGGATESNETPEQAVRREAKEETGLDVELIKKIGERSHPKTGKTIHYFHCRTTSQQTKVDPTKNDDLESLAWVPISELQTNMPTLFPAVKDYLMVLPGTTV